MPTTKNRRRPVALLTGCLLAGLLGAGGALGVASPASASTPWPGHPGRHLVGHTVRPGETATGLAVRFHAWTRELIHLNHLGRSGHLYVGQHIRIPVVDAAARRHRHHHARRHARHHHVRHHHVRHHHVRHHHVRHHHASTRAERLRRAGWRGFDLSRTRVRHLIVGSARHHGVPPNLALAIAWQESGWQQPLISAAGAIGVMQLLPATGRWMSLYAGKSLHLRHVRDNIHGGVELIRVLRASTRDNKDAIAAYYQGLGAVRAHGWYRDTVGYVRSVRAIRHRLHHGLAP